MVYFLSADIERVVVSMIDVASKIKDRRIMRMRTLLIVIQQLTRRPLKGKPKPALVSPLGGGRGCINQLVFCLRLPYLKKLPFCLSAQPTAIYQNQLFLL